MAAPPGKLYTIMNIPSISPDVFLAFALVLATPWIYKAFAPFLHDSSIKSQRTLLLSLLLLGHTLFMLYKLLVAQPINIFEMVGLSATAPPELLRSRVEELYGWIPEELELLLKRMGLVDMRSYYILFGHDALLKCTYCGSLEDFALFALPYRLLEYFRELAVVGILTLPGTTSGYLRPLGLGALLAAFLAEVYWTLTTPIFLPAPGSPTPVFMAPNNIYYPQWHDYFVQLRHILFLALPLVVSIFPWLGLHRLPILGAFLPHPPAQRTVQAHPPVPGLPPTISQVPLNQVTNMMIQTLNHLMPTLHLLKYTHAAIMRSQPTGEPEDENAPPTPFERAAVWWAQEAREGQIVREDEEVKKRLKMAGLDYEPGTDGRPDGPLLDNVKKAVGMFKMNGSVPSQWWAFGPPASLGPKPSEQTNGS